MQLDHNTLLMGAFGTTEAEVEQLRDGKLPEKQHKRLWRSFVTTSVPLTVIPIVMFIFIVVSAFALPARGLANPQSLGLCFAQMLMWGMVIGYSYAIIRQYNKTKSDTAQKRVELISGFVQQIPPVYRMPPRVMIDGKKLTVTEDQYAAFQHMQPYTLYYTPTTYRVLGAERYYGEKPKNYLEAPLPEGEGLG